MSKVVYRPNPILNKYSNSIPDTIFHYTSPEGLIGIITNSELWFSRYDCLNDASEGKYIELVYERALKAIENEYDRNFINLIRDIKPDKNRFFKLKGSSVTKTKNSESYYVAAVNTMPFICCFSLSDDSLPMWNYYSKYGRCEGYNIGFSVEKLKEIKNLEVIRCIYKEEEQVEVLKIRISEAYDNYSTYGNQIGFIKQQLAMALATLSMQFKYKAYEHEDEVRLIYWRPDKSEIIDEKGEDLFYRQTNGIIIPYVKKHIVLKDVVNRIKIGPLIKADAAEVTVRDMLKEKGIEPFISQSDIPIRY